MKVGNATEARTSGVTLLDAHRLYAIRGNSNVSMQLHYTVLNHLHLSFQCTACTDFPRREKLPFPSIARRKKMEEPSTNQH